MFFHGEADTLVTEDQALAFKQALEKAGAPTTFVHIRGGTRINLVLSGGPDSLGDAVRWFDRHLKAAAQECA